MMQQGRFHNIRATGLLSSQRLISVSLLITLSACQGTPEQSPAITRHDSVGVHIIENGAGRTSRANQWTVAPRPFLDIGMVAGPEEYRLYRVADARILRDTSVLVVNAGSQQVRHFDAAGRFLSAFGRAGEGPGEFRSPWRISPFGEDTVAVWDRRLLRIAIFTLSGTFVRQIALEGAGAHPTLVAAFPDGSFLMRNYRYDLPKSGFGTSRFTLTRYSSTGASPDSLGAYFLGRYGIVRFGNIVTIRPPVFGAQGEVAASDARFWVGSGKAYEIARYDLAGRLLDIVRWHGPSREIASADVDAYWTRALAGLTGTARQRVEQMREATPVSDRFPAYAALQVADQGRLWVQAYRRPRASEVDTWWVFGVDGELMATAAIPSTLHVTDIDGQLVLGIERDSLDVEHVRIYQLQGN